ncbi:MAG: NAD-binding protein [Acidimicrobiia bacterium]|nr:NAD-binding protein [Acidimicrobiia bacterium]MDH3396493.1 NAD-binding protein [Acidimicrobiia bacterium]MDH5615021.1 NAD-binding protein [Acidimicrobiia bacterium]
MRTLIIGGGKVGSYLGLALSSAGHTITIVEADPEKAQVLGDRSRFLVLAGDGTEVDVLNRADAARSDWVLGVTGKDEANLVACQLAKTLGGKRVIARLNDPRNRATFDALNLPVVAVTDLIVDVISQEVQVEISELERLRLLGAGKLSLVEIDIPDNAAIRTVLEIDMPPQSILVTLLRGEDISVPNATTQLRPGDRVLAVTAIEHESDLREALAMRPTAKEPT